MATAEKRNDYWARKKQDLQISKLKNWALCPRCKKLQNSTCVNDVERLGPDSSMTIAFQQEVRKIRQVQNAVVVLCVDAINFNGTLIRTIRNYVGGNPILLAVTRCDLLPPYILQEYEPTELKQVFLQRARDISPADVYLCSVEREYNRENGDVGELANDLWKHLHGREPYIVGTANIGKSTLTDVLVSDFIERGEQEGHFGDRLSRKRLTKLKESRVTKSALPGTTLQNIRVPCFPDHKQALWDTPGLLLDESVKHFPIRNFRQIRAQKPCQIKPEILQVTEKSFAMLICEKGDDMPLLRIEVRLKKSDEGEGPVRLVWNSILELDIFIVDIDQARQAEAKRMQQLEKDKGQEANQNRMKDDGGDDERKVLSKEEKAKQKAERKRAYEERVRQEQRELGMDEWKRQQKEKMVLQEQVQRLKSLAKLHEVNEVICDAGVGMDIAVAHFGWLGILPPRSAMIRTFAPSTGVQVTNHSALALPREWGDYKPYIMEEQSAGEHDGASDGDSDGASDGASDGDSDDDDYDFDDHYHLDGYDDDLEFSGSDEEGYESFEDEDYDDWQVRRSGARSQRRYKRGQRTVSKKIVVDYWASHSGKNVGWKFDADTRWSEGKLEEGWNPIREEKRDEAK